MQTSLIMHNKGKIHIILLGKPATDGKVFFDSLANLEMPHSIMRIRSIGQVLSYLKTVSLAAPSVLVIYVTEPAKFYLNDIREIRQSEKYKNLFILMYDPSGAVRDEEAFAAGANIYMHKPVDTMQFKTKLRHLFGINYQYIDGNLDKETFFLSV